MELGIYRDRLLHFLIDDEVKIMEIWMGRKPLMSTYFDTVLDKMYLLVYE